MNQKTIIIGVSILALIITAGLYVMRDTIWPVTPAIVSKLKITDTKVGTGKEVKMGDTVTVYDTMTLLDGTILWSSFEGNGRQSQAFKIYNNQDTKPKPTITVVHSFGEALNYDEANQGRVILGFEHGVIGMKVGGKRTLVIPPELAFGVRGAPRIPPNSTITIEVELINIQ